MTLRILLASLFVAPVLLLAGCNSNSAPGATAGGAYREVSLPPELVARARPRIPDLPVPIGFDIDEGRSRDFAAAGLRWVDHVYKGKANKFAVQRFYERHMPIARWVLVTYRFVQGEITLDFEKETERCVITVAKGSLFHPTYIKVALWTSGRIETPKTNEGKPKPAK